MTSKHTPAWCTRLECNQDSFDIDKVEPAQCVGCEDMVEKCWDCVKWVCVDTGKCILEGE